MLDLDAEYRLLNRLSMGLKDEVYIRVYIRYIYIYFCIASAVNTLINIERGKGTSKRCRESDFVTINLIILVR